MQTRQLWLTAVLGAVLAFAAVAGAQDRPTVTVRADRIAREQSPPRTTYIGNVVVEIDGRTVRGRRAVLQDNELLLDGRVRLPLPKSANVISLERKPTPEPTVMVPRPYRVATPIVDTPIPEPWQPPARK